MLCGASDDDMLLYMVYISQYYIILDIGQFQVMYILLYISRFAYLTVYKLAYGIIFLMQSGRDYIGWCQFCIPNYNHMVG